MARCPECGHKLAQPADPKRWDHIYCEACRAELEILNTMPLELEAVFDFEDTDLIAELNDQLAEGDELEHDDIVWSEDDDGDTVDEEEQVEVEEEADEEEAEEEEQEEASDEAEW